MSCDTGLNVRGKRFDEVVMEYTHLAGLRFNDYPNVLTLYPLPEARDDYCIVIIASCPLFDFADPKTPLG